MTIYEQELPAATDEDTAILARFGGMLDQEREADVYGWILTRAIIRGWTYETYYPEIGFSWWYDDPQATFDDDSTISRIWRPRC